MCREFKDARVTSHTSIFLEGLFSSFILFFSANQRDTIDEDDHDDGDDDDDDDDNDDDDDDDDDNNNDKDSDDPTVV